MCRLALIGGGGHALSLLEILPGDMMVAGYVDFRDVPGMTLSRLGDDQSFVESASKDLAVLITMVSGKSCSLSARARLIRMYEGYVSPVIVASTAVVAGDVAMGDGTAVFHRAVVNAGTSLGRHCIVNTGAIVEHGCTLGDNVFVGPGAVVCGGVTIGDNVYIGANATLRPGVKVCSDAIIGLGAAVVTDIVEPGTYVDIPARKIK